MKIYDLFRGTNYTPINGHSEYLEKPLAQLTCDSRNVRQGSVFVAIRGERFDGHDFVREAFRKGAEISVIDRMERGRFSGEEPIVLIENPRRTFAELAARFFDSPSDDVRLVGVTGTNGKTTVTHLLHELFGKSFGCGMIGTIRHRVGDRSITAKNTTPSAYEINEMLAEMRSIGIRYAAMEVSSHALDQDRVACLKFHQAIFTNLTRDHLDYHGNFTNYFEAKKKLFLEKPRPKAVFVNVDDRSGEWLYQNLKPRPFSYGLRPSADFQARQIEMGLEKIRFQLHAEDKRFVIECPLMGRHNVYNLLAASAAAWHEGLTISEIQERLACFPGVPGRLERIDRGQDFTVFVDYAHTPDAFEQVLGSMKPLTRRSMITVFGCGGDRDRGKRPLMGKIASKYSDSAFITSDNPRSEEPEAIIREIQKGVPAEKIGSSIFCIPDREEAIGKALDRARTGDVVMILGKGHEDYQIIGEKKIHFSDQEVVEKYLR